MGGYPNVDELQHFGIKGMKWGIRRYQNSDGTLTEAGKKRYGSTEGLRQAQERSAARKKTAAKVAKTAAVTAGAAALAAVAGPKLAVGFKSVANAVGTKAYLQKLNSITRKYAGVTSMTDILQIAAMRGDKKTAEDIMSIYRNYDKEMEKSKHR